MQKIGILGSGTVGQALGIGFIKHGYQVMVGTRDVSKLAEWKSGAGKKAFTGSFASAAAFGEIIVLAVKGTAAKAVLNIAGHENMESKIIIDATNPIADAPPENDVLNYFSKINKSLMEELQAAFPKANFVKSFNMIGSHLMVNPDFGGEKATMFICGNDEDAKNAVSEILDKFGFEAEDMGGVESARAIEPLAMLWCIPGFRENIWGNAFKLLKL